MPYRIDLHGVPANLLPAEALDRLVTLGALDVDATDDGRGLAAILPDHVGVSHVAQALGVAAGDLRVTAAQGRDDASVWLVSPRVIRVGRLRIAPSTWPAEAGTLRLVDGAAFGTGLHPTTALCLEALEEELRASTPAAVLDVGAGSGVLALAALMAGVPHATAVDVDAEAVRVARENARLNGVAERFEIVHGGPEAVSGTWPLVLANVLAAPLIAMAPTLARRVGHGGRVMLSGIRSSLVAEVEQAYRHVGMRALHAEARDGWSALIVQASW